MARRYTMRFTTGDRADMYPEVVQAMERMIREMLARHASESMGVPVNPDDVRIAATEETVAPRDDDEPFEPFKVTVYYGGVEVED